MGRHPIPSVIEALTRRNWKKWAMPTAQSECALGRLGTVLIEWTLGQEILHLKRNNSWPKICGHEQEHVHEYEGRHVYEYEDDGGLPG
jgi:hypothetical protein